MVLEPAFRAVLVTSLMVLVGVPPTLLAAVFPVLRRRGVDPAPAHRTALRFVVPSLVAALVSATVLTVHRLSTGSPDATGFVLVVGTELGTTWVAQVALGLTLVALTIVGAMGARRVSRRRWLSAVTVGALGMLAVFCWTRYSTAVSSRELAVLVKWVHMSGAALWVGGLFVMAKLPSLLPTDADGDLEAVVAAFIRRFSMLAVAGVTIAFVTGILITSWHVPSFDALVATPYGLVVVAKVVLVLGAAGLGGFNRFVLHGQIQGCNTDNDRQAVPGFLVLGHRLRTQNAVRTFLAAVRLELAVLVAALLASVILTAVLPPSYTVVDAPSEQILLTVAGTARTAATDLLLFAPGSQLLSTWFAELLQLGAVSVALVGSLALGYELGEFGAHRR